MAAFDELLMQFKDRISADHMRSYNKGARHALDALVITLKDPRMANLTVPQMLGIIEGIKESIKDP